MTLYELTDNLLALLEMMEDPDEDPDAIIDTADAIEMDFNDKADAYATIIGAVNADIEQIAAEQKRLATRKQAMTRNADRMKAHLQKAMEATGKTKFKTALHSFNVQNNPPSVVLETDDPWKVPEQYIDFLDPVINKKAILDDLKRGVELPGVAHLEQKKSLRIK